MSERERAMLEVPELDATMRLKSILSGERLVAVEKSTGIKLVRSGGRSRRGSAPNYILIVYSSCNPRVRAWSDEEAIEAANQKLERLRKQSKVPPIELPEGAEER